MLMVDIGTFGEAKQLGISQFRQEEISYLRIGTKPTSQLSKCNLGFQEQG